MKRVLLIATILALIAPVATSQAELGVKKIETKVILKKVDQNAKSKRGTWYFHGRYESKKPACERERYVEVERDGISVSNDVTDEKGRFSVPVNAFSPGTYKVYAAPLEEPNFTCKADRSKPYVRELR